jgi:hypothetical protein
MHIAHMYMDGVGGCMHIAHMYMDGVGGCMHIAHMYMDGVGGCMHVAHMYMDGVGCMHIAHMYMDGMMAAGSAVDRDLLDTPNFALVQIFAACVGRGGCAIRCRPDAGQMPSRCAVRCGPDVGQMSVRERFAHASE